MNQLLAALAGGILAGTLAAAHAKLPPPTDEEKAAAAQKAEKAAMEKDKAAKDLSKAHDRVVENYRKNKGSASGGATAQPQDTAQGADHGNAPRPDGDLTRQEAQKEMPLPGQANDHSTPARDPQNSGGNRTN